MEDIIYICDYCGRTVQRSAIAVEEILPPICEHYDEGGVIIIVEMKNNKNGEKT